MNRPEENGSRPATPGAGKRELPDLFAWPDGRRVATREEWAARRQAWLETIVDVEYGGLPPGPTALDVETLCRGSIRSLPGNPGHRTCRINCEGGERPFSFCARLVFPRSPDPVPVIATGDACWWWCPRRTTIEKVLQRGYALAIFNRTEMAADLGHADCPDKTRRAGGLYDVYPGLSFGALAAWAWGYHRCVDFLLTMPFIDARRIAVSGHSRGGKTTLLAGATDERIAVVNDNASGAGGSAVFRHAGDGAETLKTIVEAFPSWFGPAFRAYAGREEELPFDQHVLPAAVAPRSLLLTYALDDRWSNPEGMVQSVMAAGEVFRFLGCPGNLAFHLRPGVHAHAPEDWDVLLDFLDWKWKGTPLAAACNRHPYTRLQPLFSWRAPAA
jgi:hypothetical protein